MRTLFRSEAECIGDLTACRVCGHRTQPIARRTLNVALLLIVGALLAYIALDVAEDGRLDGSLFHVLTGSSRSCVSVSDDSSAERAARDPILPSLHPPLDGARVGNGGNTRTAVSGDLLRWNIANASVRWFQWSPAIRLPVLLC